MILQEVFDYINLKSNKDQLGNTFGPDLFNTALLSVNTEYFKWKYGLPEEYRPGQPLPRMSYEITQKIQDDMKNFRVITGRNTPPMLVDANGQADLPADYVHQSSAMYIYSVNMGKGVAPKTEKRSIDFLTDDQWAIRINDAVTAPTKDYPIAQIQNTYIEFEPKDLGMVEFRYLRLPKVPFYDFNIVNDEQVYLPPGGTHDGSNQTAGTASRSVELEWPADTHIGIADVIIGYLGLNLRDGNLVNDSEKKKAKGI